MVQQFAVKGTYQQGMVKIDNQIAYESATDIILVFPLRPDTALQFESVENEEIQLCFKHSIKAKLFADEDVLFVTYPDFDITAYGQDLREAIQNFHEVFIATFDHYTNQPDHELTSEAQHLKAALLNLVEQQICLNKDER